MTQVGEEIQISAESVIRHYRLPVSEGSNTFLINTAGNCVSSIQITDQKLLQSWTLTHPECFTSPAAFNSDDDSICCIVDNKKLLVWNVAVENLKAAQKQKFTNSIFAVIPVKGRAPVIAFCTGAVVPLECIQNTDSFIGPPDLSSREELVWTDAALSNKNIVIAQLISNKQAKKFRVQSFVLRDGVIDATSYASFDLSKESSCMKSYCLNSRLKQIRFLCIWDNGEVCSYSLDGSTSELLFRVCNINKLTTIAIDIVGTSRLAVAKLGSSHTKEEAVVEVWDLKYCVMKASKVLKRSLPKNFQMKSLDSSVFLASNEGIIMVPITVEACTLSAVVGKSVVTSELSTESTYSWSTSCNDENASVTPMEVQLTKPSTKELFEKVIPQMPIEDVKTYCENLAKSSEVSEAELVKILKFVLNEEHLKCRRNSEDNNKLRSIVLNAVFRISFSDIFLRQHLKQLTFTETVIVLESLLQIFSSQLFSTEESEQPTDLQIVSWMQLLLQVHFEELLLSPDENVQKLLKKLQTSLFEKMDVYSELGEIKYLLMVQKKKNILPDKSVHSKYRIETLYL